MILCVTISIPLVIFLSTRYCFGGDLDDKISQYTDESVDADDQMGNDDPNINFIVLDAMSKAKAKMGKIDKEGKGKTSSNNDESNFSSGSGSSSNVNSVVVGPGSQVKDIYNIVIKK